MPVFRVSGNDKQKAVFIKPIDLEDLIEKAKKKLDLAPDILYRVSILHKIQTVIIVHEQYAMYVVFIVASSCGLRN